MTETRSYSVNYPHQHEEQLEVDLRIREMTGEEDQVRVANAKARGVFPSTPDSRPSSSFRFRNSNFGFLPRPRRIGPKSNRKIYCISLEKILAQLESILSVIVDRNQEGAKQDGRYSSVSYAR